jgi:glutamate--cysteine ligase
MLVKNESDYENWQEEALINEELSAERAFDDEMRLIRDGEEVTLKEWGLELINEMHHMVDELGIYYHDMLDLMTLRLENPHVTYSQRLVKLIEKQGYINTIVDLSLKNKQKYKNTKIKEMKEYRKLALN